MAIRRRALRRFETSKTPAKKVALAGRPKPERCELCDGLGKTLVWDHNHTTGEFRGWLCIGCNSGLGMFCDNPVLLQRAIAYLASSGLSIRQVVETVFELEKV